jgi:hypothetical protein
VAGEELAWQERKAESFVITPIYCGSESTGYARLPDKECDLTLGRAIAISGAAASPNMGYHTSAPLAALMTIFNLRLGWWLENPAKPQEASGWKAANPKYGTLLWDELIARTDALGKYVYLSDGGHFENLGVYELVRRRCRYIVAIDAGADPGYEFEDLGNLIRKCRNDFGIRVDIDVDPIQRKGGETRSRWHCAVGTIHYEDVDDWALPGTLVYLKPSLTGNEPSDVLTYAADNPSFPHQPTADQFFSESQFESYRALGHHIAQEVFGDAVQEKESEKNRVLFSRLRQRWFAPPPDLEKNFLESVKGFLEVQKGLRGDANLRPLSHDLYPELDSNGDTNASHGPLRGTVPFLPSSAGSQPSAAAWIAQTRKEQAIDQQCAELHAVSQMLQVMENTWLGVRLGVYHEHPLNRGWMNVFRRWTNSDAFSRHWPVLRGEYSQDFVRFCEKELRLEVYDTRAVPLIARNPPSELKRPTQERENWALKKLDEEFSFEWWFSEKSKGRSLSDRIASAKRLELANGPPVWILWSIPASKSDLDATPVSSDEDDYEEGYPCGIILACEPLAESRGTLGCPLARCSHLQARFEFFVWIRGAYRNAGIGRMCVEGRDPHHLDGPKRERVLDTVWNELGKTLKDFTLFVRYPADASSARAEVMEKALWSNFFYAYDFRKAKAAADGKGEDLILECTSKQHEDYNNLRQWRP